MNRFYVDCRQSLQRCKDMLQEDPFWLLACGTAALAMLVKLNRVIKAGRRHIAGEDAKKILNLRHRGA